MPEWMWWILGFVFGPLPIVGAAILSFYLYYRWYHLEKIVRIFEEKPIFIIPRGEAPLGAEEVRVPTPDGLVLHACYLRTTQPVRRGVIFFGLEFGSNCWACVPYSQKLRDAGYDIFACELRNQGKSDADPTYEPLQWTTDRDLSDSRAALNALLARPDADPSGVGIFGISKGGSLGLLLAAENPMVRCVATDGAFATYGTVIPFMRRFVAIYFKKRNTIRRMIPDWFHGMLGLAAMARVERKRNIVFVSIERAVRRLRRPLFMIHGGGDTYITPEMSTSLFQDAKRSVERVQWIIPAAKHNQALRIAGAEYHDRLVNFFDQYLGCYTPQDATAAAEVLKQK